MRMYCEYQSPIGILRIEEENGAIVGLHRIQDPAEADTQAVAQKASTTLLQQAVRELQEYFAGGRRTFDLPVALEGTPFRKKVWAKLRAIPYGETISYGELARRIGNPKAVRAVGGANHHNPVMIIVPCHRVIGADGSLVGFGAGLDAKRYLLELERGASGIPLLTLPLR